jgi:hypothetical protein
VGLLGGGGSRAVFGSNTNGPGITFTPRLPLWGYLGEEDLVPRQVSFQGIGRTQSTALDGLAGLI